MTSLFVIGYALAASLLYLGLHMHNRTHDHREEITLKHIMEKLMSINSKLDAISAAIAAIPAGGNSAQLAQIASDVTAIKNEIGITGVPVVSAISPTTGSINGGETITLTGSNLVGVTSVLVGAVAATGITVQNDTALTFISTAQAAGTFPVTAINANGTSVVNPTVNLVIS